ncbi:MAG: amidase [Cyclobacteriaceae bacterium]|nr:amidase [Cyclobacteriaceae bacterium]
MKTYLYLALAAYPLFLLSIAGCTDSAAGEQNVAHEAAPTTEIEKWYDLSFTMAERDSMQGTLENRLEAYQQIHAYSPAGDVPMSLYFNPLPIGFEMPKEQKRHNWNLPKTVNLPENPADLAFYPVADLAVLLRTGKITSVELTRFYINRLKKYGDSLQCVVTLTEELALKQAAKADKEIRTGTYRGPLHGIPYGVKDLFAVEGYKTTWGAGAYKDQVIDQTATVVNKLEEAGAVLVAKLTLGALAMGDVWFGGVTKNPWNTVQGSSGSSAGSASAAVAGLVGFAIGTETRGSIVSPSTRCGASGLRPTYGRVSRTGAMALSWSMDKVGPICRTAQGAALVFQSIIGPDGKDQTLLDAPFNFDAGRDMRKLKVGYIKSYFDSSKNANDALALEAIRNMGVEPVAMELPTNVPVRALSFILAAEAAAAFDVLTRSNRDSLLVRQDKWAWPNYFRAARFIPAVEYINANRLRFQLVQEIHAIMKDYDVVITPSFGGDQLLITNLTSNPCVVVPSGFNEEGSPTSISFLGNLYDEGTLLEFAHAYQQATGHEDVHPEWLRE